MSKRRPKGAGGLRHLGGERWQLLLKTDGGQVSRVFSARNATEANAAVPRVTGELLADVERRKDSKGAERAVRQSWTVERYVEYYLAEWGAYHLADTTRTRYKSIFKHQVCPHIGRLTIAEVTPAHLTAMYSALASPKSRKRGEGALAGATIATVHNVVRALFAFAVEVQGDLPTNPAASRAARPKVDKTPRSRTGMTVSDVEAFVRLAAERAPDIAVPVMLSAYLGTRRGETVGLRWEDVDFEAATITVRRSVSRTVVDGVNVKSTKTGKHRTIPLDTHTVSMLRTIRARQRRERARLGAAWRGAKTAELDYIAAEPDGSLMRPDVFGNSFRTLCKQEKVPNVTPHLLRHAWVSQMIALGFDAVTIAAMSGHSPDVLLKVYAHAFDARKREAMDALAHAREEARAAL